MYVILNNNRGKNIAIYIFCFRQIDLDCFYKLAIV